MTGCARPISAKPDLQDQRDSLITRPLVGWIGRALFLWTVAKLASCSFETWIGVYITSQRTTSEHGGVVSEPRKV